MPSGLAAHITATKPTPEFDTFEIVKARRKRGSKYDFLREMPTGAHYHFSGHSPRVIRNVVTQLNRGWAKQGIHFACYLVGDDDPKGQGIRVLRDDKPMRPRT